MTNSINELDYDSPGYEFLRLHRGMMNLYYKLVALDYQHDFCPVYKCPCINKFYFSVAQSNSFEQKYLFTSLCAWLIRDKCQMNFEMELEDMSSSLGVILEALRVLHDDRDLDSKFQSRLEQGHGPEVVYALSCLADRALELAQEHDPLLGSSPDIRFHNKQHDQTRPANSITIGQPIAGGTLTTRSLGKYLIEDSSLVLDYQGDDTSYEETETVTAIRSGGEPPVDAEDWLCQVEKSADLLVQPYTSANCQVWRESLQQVVESKRTVEAFLSRSRPIIVAVGNRVERELGVVATREKFLQKNLQPQLEAFLGVWREHSARAKENKLLLDSVNQKTDMFESYNTRLKLLAADIETRVRELNDGSKLKELESIIKTLDSQSDELDVRIGLVMAAHSRSP